MQHLFIYFICSVLCTSCATVLNLSNQKINITADSGIKILSIDSAVKYSPDGRYVYIKRSKAPLKINVQKDTTTTSIFLKPHLSAAFYSNLLFFYGVGMLVDLKNPKRFAYPKYVYLQRVSAQNNKDTGGIKVMKFGPTNKGITALNYTIPYINNFYIAQSDGYRYATGFRGMQIGFDQFYKKNKYLSLQFGLASNLPVPVPVAVDYYGTYQSSACSYINIKNSLRTKRIDWGYGLSMGRMYWRKSNNVDTSFKTQSKTSHLIGLNLSASYRIKKVFLLGLQYQPYFVQYKKPANQDYQHMLSISMIWSVPLFKH